MYYTIKEIKLDAFPRRVFAIIVVVLSCACSLAGSLASSNSLRPLTSTPHSYPEHFWIAMLTPTVTQFLSEVSTIIRQRNASRLCDYLVIEPPYSTIYETLRAEVRASYNAQDGTAAQRLETACTQKLGNVLADPEGNAPTWTAFAKFITQYFIFLRDVDVGNLLATYESLSELLQ